MPILPKTIEIFSRFNQDTQEFEMQILPQLKAFCCGYKIRAIKITAEEIVDWDVAKMRAFLHGTVLPAFQEKYKEACIHPDKKEITIKLVKSFLKARFLGFVEDADYNMWRMPLNIDDQTQDLFTFIRLKTALSSIKNPPRLISTEDISPVLYWKFLRSCEAYFQDLFHDCYDKRNMPEKPLES